MSWVNRSVKNEAPKELLLQFEDLYSRLHPNATRLLENKCWLLLQSVNRSIRASLLETLEDNETGDIIENWGMATKTIQRLSKRIDNETLLNAKDQLQSTSQSKSNSVDDLVKEFADLKLFVAKVTGEKFEKKNDRKQKVLCIWCDSAEHRKADCESLEQALKSNLVKNVDSKLAFFSSGNKISLNFSNGGMKKIVEDFYSTQPSRRNDEVKMYSVKAEAGNCS